MLGFGGMWAPKYTYEENRSYKIWPPNFRHMKKISLMKAQQQQTITIYFISQDFAVNKIQQNYTQEAGNGIRHSTVFKNFQQSIFPDP